MISGSHHTEATKQKLRRPRPEEVTKKIKINALALWRKGWYRKKVMAGRKRRVKISRVILTGALEYYQRQKRLKRCQLASVLKMSPQHLKRLINGLPFPARTAKRISDTTGIPVSVLVKPALSERALNNIDRPRPALSAEAKEKLGRAMRQRWQDPEYRNKQSKKYRSAVTHRFWRGGENRERHAPGFTDKLRFQIRARDGFVCMICGAPENGRAHHVHHIDHSKHNHDPRNLITLCHPCHSKETQSQDSWAAYFSDMFSP